MESVVPCRNVYIGLIQEQGPGPIVSYCTSPILCMVLVPLLCSVNKPSLGVPSSPWATHANGETKYRSHNFELNTRLQRTKMIAKMLPSKINAVTPEQDLTQIS